MTKTVLVGPKGFWSDQIDLDLTIMIWSRPKWNGHNQNELVRSKLWFSTKMNHNLDLTNSFWSWPFHYGCDQIIMVKSKTILDRPKLFWSHRRTRHKRFRAVVVDEQGRRKEDFLKIIQDLQCFKCKKVPLPYGDQRKRYLCKNSFHSMCEYHSKITCEDLDNNIFGTKCPCGSLHNGRNDI